MFKKADDDNTITGFSFAKKVESLGSETERRFGRPRIDGLQEEIQK